LLRVLTGAGPVLSTYPTLIAALTRAPRRTDGTQDHQHPGPATRTAGNSSPAVNDGPDPSALCVSDAHTGSA
jgi:hypothetical protein